MSATMAGELARLRKKLSEANQQHEEAIDRLLAMETEKEETEKNKIVEFKRLMKIAGEDPPEDITVESGKAFLERSCQRSKCFTVLRRCSERTNSSWSPILYGG